MEKRPSRFRRKPVRLWSEKHDQRRINQRILKNKLRIIEKYIDNLHGCKVRADYYEEKFRKTQAELISAARQKASQKTINRLGIRVLREKLASAKYRAMQAQEHLALDDFFRWLEINEPTKGQSRVAKITQRISSRGTQIVDEQKRQRAAGRGVTRLTIDTLMQETLELNGKIARAQNDKAELTRIAGQIDRNWEAIGRLTAKLRDKGGET